MPNYFSDSRPDFSPCEIDCGAIKCYEFKSDLRKEIASGRLDHKTAVQLLEDMLTIREFEEMIVKLRSGAYQPLPDYNYRGPTHLSIGQEAASAGTCHALQWTDYITSTHRGHGDSIAKGCVALRFMPDEALKKRVPGFKGASREALVEAAIEDHIFRTIAELFGKESGYCKGRGGGMHIADFTMNHLGANAIVGGGVPIANGLAWAKKRQGQGHVAYTFFGDGGAYIGAVPESMNLAALWNLPICFFIENNGYAVATRLSEQTRETRLSSRGGAFAIPAYRVDGMDPVAVRLASNMALAHMRTGGGPAIIEALVYRFFHHGGSLQGSAFGYREKEEEVNWKARDPLARMARELAQRKWLTATQNESIRQHAVSAM
ncbi:MAG: thiamine pyrophosphate-dependent dehydrogenase E1 component subunit alpha, partial [Kiritimatiellia bacterium]